MELLQAFLILIGLIGARLAEPSEDCPGGACADAAARPVVGWTAPQTVRADEFRLFSRGECRPGQSAPTIVVVRATAARDVLVVAPARERLAPTLRCAPAAR